MDKGQVYRTLLFWGALLVLLGYWQGWPYLIAGVGLASALMAAFPPLAVLFFRGVWGITRMVGWLNGLVLLTLVYVLVLTPVAWLSRRFRPDPLQLKKPTDSPWQMRDHRFGPDDLQQPW